jgi:DinB superfamily
MPDETLSLLLQDVRGKTLKIIGEVTEQQSRFAPPGLHNTILWHAGHSLIVVEHLAVSSATGKPPVFPHDWFDKFSWKSQPATVTQWPTLAEVKAKLIDQAERLGSAIKSLSEDQLKQQWGDPTKGRTVRWAILHGLHDEAGHQGEMWLLKKLQTARS